MTALNTLLVHRHYTLLLIGLIGALVGYPLIHNHAWLVQLVELFIAAVILHTYFQLRGNHWSFYLCFITGIIAFTLSSLFARDKNPVLVVVHLPFMLLFLFFVTLTFLKDLASQKVITRDTIMGALSVYILIALLFSNVYSHLEALSPNAFWFNHNGLTAYDKLFDLTYFSFTTLSTVGFGDIVPLSRLAKGIVIIEEITGLFYLAILVSRLVSSFKIPD